MRTKILEGLYEWMTMDLTMSFWVIQESIMKYWAHHSKVPILKRIDEIVGLGR